MHPKEAKKERTGTGRLTHLSLKNSRIVIGENFDQHEEIQQILADQNLNCFLLYPGSSSQNLDIGAPMQMQNAEAQKKINVIFVIDGTWSCAKSMMRDSLTLHGLPRVSFNSDKKSNFAIKQQPNSYCLSSIESIFYVLDALNRFKIEDIKNSEHKNLLILLDKMCEFQVACTQLPDSRRYRPGNYKRSHEKRVSKKWVKRKVYFE
jgi:DTW domain-containing protein YfiP